MCKALELKDEHVSVCVLIIVLDLLCLIARLLRRAHPVFVGTRFVMCRFSFLGLGRASTRLGQLWVGLPTPESPAGFTGGWWAQDSCSESWQGSCLLGPHLLVSESK